VLSLSVLETDLTAGRRIFVTNADCAEPFLQHLQYAWCYEGTLVLYTRFVLLTYLSPIILFTCTFLRSILSNELNSTSAVATSMSLKGRTKPSLVQKMLRKPRLDSLCHRTPYSFSHMISPVVFSQPVIASINTLHVSSSLRV
jgi:hypothetical protein